MGTGCGLCMIFRVVIRVKLDYTFCFLITLFAGCLHYEEGVIFNFLIIIRISTLPDEMATAIEACGFFESIPLWAVTLIGSLLITILSFIMILTVYGRFFSFIAIPPLHWWVRSKWQTMS